MPPRVKTARPVAQLRQGRTDWYRITNFAGDGGAPADVVIYDEIGYWGVTASDFLNELKSITAPEISLRLNSPGGEIFDGIAIHNALRSHPANVTTYVDSLAASIASVIALAGDRVVMMPHSQMMIHDGSGLAIGNANDMREMADLLDRQSDNIAGVYAEAAGGTVEDWRALMLAETWFTADEAVAAGLADEVAQTRPQPADDAPAMDNSWDLSIFRYAGRDAAPAPAPVVNTSAEPAPAEPVTPAAPVAADAAEAMRKIHAAAQKPEPVAAEPEPPELVVPEPEPVHDRADDSVTATAADVSWAHITAHLTEPEPDGWAALTSHLTTTTASPQRGDEA